MEKNSFLFVLSSCKVYFWDVQHLSYKSCCRLNHWLLRAKSVNDINVLSVCLLVFRSASYEPLGRDTGGEIGIYGAKCSIFIC